MNNDKQRKNTDESGAFSKDFSGGYFIMANQLFFFKDLR